MPLGTLDFTGVTNEFPVLTPGDYDGQTKTWELVDNKPTKKNPTGEGQHIFAKFVVTREDEDGNEENVTLFKRWFLGAKSLWVIKRDLIDMGADPAELEGDAVDLEALLNDRFGQIPTPVTITVKNEPYTPEGGETRINNVVDRVKLRS